jgi:tetratricopeptide (TPR) repeat protein
MEAPGRPAVTWHSDAGDSSEPSKTQSQNEIERELLAELHAAEGNDSDDLALATTLYNLGILRRQQGDFAEAARLYRRALDIRERKEGPNHPDVAATLNNLAAVEALQGHYEEAKPLLERALSIRRKTFGDEDVLTAESLNNLALLYAAQGNAVAAEPLYQQALAILDKPNVDQKGALDRVLDNYAALLYDTGRDSEAAQLEARARLLRATEPHPREPSP